MIYHKILTKRNFVLIVLVISSMLLITACGGANQVTSDDATEVVSDEASDDDETSADDVAPAEAEDIVSNAPDANELYLGITDTTDGEALYVTLCAKCHGLEGNGDGPSLGSLNLTGSFVLTVVGAKTDEELLETITFGTGIDMPAWGLILSLEQRESVLAYVRTLSSDE